MLCRAQLWWEALPELPRAAEVAIGSLSRVNNNVGSQSLTSLGGVLGRGLEVGTGQETKDREEFALTLSQPVCSTSPHSC